MSQCKKAERKSAVAQYVFIIIASLFITCFSAQTHAQGDSSTMAPGRRHGHERPSHPKPSFKKFFNKVNIFKKDKDQDQTQEQTQVQPQNTSSDNGDKSPETAKTISSAKTVSPPPPPSNTTNPSKKTSRAIVKANPSPEIKAEGVKAPNATTPTTTGVGPLAKPAAVKKSTSKSSKQPSNSKGQVTKPII